MVGLFGGEITLSLPLIPIRAMTMQGSYTGSLDELKELIDAGAQRAVAAGADQDRAARRGADAVIADIKAGKVIGRGC